MPEVETRGRKEQEKVKVSKVKDQSTRLVPLHDKQLEKAGIDPESENVVTERVVRDGEEEILLKLEDESE